MNRRLLVTLLTSCVLGAGVQNRALAQSIDISVDAGRISLVASQARLASIAEQLAERTGIPIILSGDADPQVSVEIIDEPLAQVVAQLSSNYLLKRRNNRPGAEIVEVMLLTDDAGSVSDTSSAGNEEFLPSGDPAPQLDSPDEGNGQYPEYVEPANDGGAYFDDPNTPPDDEANGSDGQQYGPAPDTEFDYEGAVTSGVGAVPDRFADQLDSLNGEPPDQAEQ